MVLHMFGLLLPEDVDGKVLKEIFNNLHSHPSGALQNFRLSLKLTDLVYLCTMSRLSQHLGPMVCSTPIDLVINAQSIIKGEGLRIMFTHS